jgi:NhaP-type Na+/H+ or K+/H+ antiporter
VLLGEQRPRLAIGSARVVSEAGHREPVWFAVYVAGITFALAVLRFIWVWTSLRFTLFRAALKGQHPYIPGW